MSESLWRERAEHQARRAINAEAERDKLREERDAALVVAIDEGQKLMKLREELACARRAEADLDELQTERNAGSEELRDENRQLKASLAELERELAVAMEALHHITLTQDEELKVSRNGMFRSAISAIQRIEAMRCAYEEGK